MHILITGAAGFVGQILAKELLNNPAHFVTLTDVIEPPLPKGSIHPQNAKLIKSDLTNFSTVTDLISSYKTLDAVFIFHGIMSSGSEANFELGMLVNIDATRNILEALRKNHPGVKVIYSSSEAVYGQPLPQVVTDNVIPTPESSYGAEKLICETLINEYSRRKFLNGFVLRFPTISVRAGAPTAAASSFLSGMIREPMNGLESVIPITDRSFASWICSPKTLVINLLHTLTLERDALPPHIRTVNLPGIKVTVQEMIDALVKFGGEEKLKLLKEERDEKLIPILDSWAVAFDNKHALSLGFVRDGSFEEVVGDYVQGLKGV